MSTKDIHIINSVPSKKSNKETITPHRIAVVLLIKEYCSLRNANSIGTFEDGSSTKCVCTVSPSERRDFCMLALKLIQCRDLELDELLALVNGGSYSLVSLHMKRFEMNLKNLFNNDIGTLQDLIQNLGSLLVDAGPGQSMPIVNKSSVIGLFLRRIMIFFDKLSFSQVVSTFQAYKAYYQRWHNKLSVAEVKEETSKMDNDNDDDLDMDLCDDDVKLPSFEFSNLLPAAKEIVECGVETETRYWTRRQAELFIAQQASYIQTNEMAAMSPPELQQKIRDLLQANPEYAEAHYLSYLNCLRSREFCGAIDSLYHCFDRNSLISDTKFTTQEEKSRGSRYAALSLAVLHSQFGHRREAMSALKEAIMLAHESNDNVCLQHALAWLYRLTEDNKEVLIERSISKSSDLNLSYLTSLGIQSFAQHAGITAGRPALVFDLLLKSDVLNCQYSMIELMANSYAQKAALWNTYGKTEMASLSSQLLLHLNTASLSLGMSTYNGEGTCQALCNVANTLVDQGEYQLASTVLQHARQRFPHEPLSHAWIFSEQLMCFTRSLHHGKWQEAEEAIAQISAIDRWESKLRQAELYLAKGDFVRASTSVYSVLDYCRKRTDEDTMSPSVRARAMILAAEFQCCSSSSSRIPSSAIPLLTTALNDTHLHYLNYLVATVGLHLANLQLQMGLPTQALKLLELYLLEILSHGSYYDQGRALLLHAKCKLAACAGISEEARQVVLLNATHTLTKVKWYFEKVEAYSRIKDVLYLMALIYNEMGCIAEKKKCALEFRQLDEQYPTKIATTLLTRL